MSSKLNQRNLIPPKSPGLTTAFLFSDGVEFWEKGENMKVEAKNCLPNCWQLKPASFISHSIDRRPLFLSLLLFRVSCGFHIKACLVVLVFGLCRVNPAIPSGFPCSAIQFSLVLLFGIGLRLRWYLANKLVDVFGDTCYESLDFFSKWAFLWFQSHIRVLIWHLCWRCEVYSFCLSVLTSTLNSGRWKPPLPSLFLLQYFCLNHHPCSSYFRGRWTSELR